MEYNLIVDDETKLIEVDKDYNEKKLDLSIEKNKYKVFYIPISENQIHLNVNGTNYNAFIDNRANSKEILINGKQYLVAELDFLIKKKTKKELSHDQENEISSPIPATVVRILVKKGDAVKKDQDVIVVSAMKMETTISTSYDGIVKKINVKKGDTVMPDEILIEIDKR